VRINGQVVPLAPRQRQAARAGSGAPRTVLKVDPRALAIAVQLAGGDRSRLEFGPDGSITIRNHSR
jgi:hypothetical protein